MNSLIGQGDGHPAASHPFIKGVVPFMLEESKRYYIFAGDVLNDFHKRKGLPQDAIDGRAMNRTAV